MTVALIAAYLAAIVTANLAVAAFGPAVTPLTAFLLIGLDLTCRDALHDRWRHRHLPARMAALIAAGSLLSWLVQPAAGRIALASAAAFALSATADAAVYHLARRRPWLQRANTSNLAGAAVDSLAFPTLAFGVLLPWIVAGQFAAKVAGGFGWSLVLARVRRRHEEASLHFHGTMKPYRIGWWTPAPQMRWYRRLHRPWQSESDACRFARRALTPSGALRKMTRDDAAARSGGRSAYQRLRWRLSPGRSQPEPDHAAARD